MRFLPLCFLVTLLIHSGCSPMRYSRYSGENAGWQTKSGSLAETSYALPVYKDWPERPYEVIGSVRHKKERKYWKTRKYWSDGTLRKAARTAKRNGGDAMILLTGSAAPFSRLDSPTSRPTGLSEAMRGLVITWTPESVLEARRAEEEQFWKGFRSKFPKLVSDEQLLQTALNNLIEADVPPHSTEMEQKLSALLTDIQDQPKNSLGGKWLFKGSVQNKNLTAMDSQKFHGVATVEVAQDRVTLVSTQGKVQVNFTGTVENGQISGTLGLGGADDSVSVKCEGVALNHRIALTFQALTGSGTVQGNVTFQR